MVTKADSNQLNKAQKRTPCYGSGPGPFDPDAASLPMEAVKSGRYITQMLKQRRATLKLGSLYLYSWPVRVSLPPIIHAQWTRRAVRVTWRRSAWQPRPGGTSPPPPAPHCSGRLSRYSLDSRSDTHQNLTSTTSSFLLR